LFRNWRQVMSSFLSVQLSVMAARLYDMITYKH
jgi:hypothetical protein